MMHNQQKRTDSFLFLSIIFACSVTAYYRQSILLGLIALYYFGMLVLKRQAFLCMICFVGLLLLSVRVSLSRTGNIQEGEYQGVVNVLPDTIKINGDLLTFEAKSSAGKVIGRYTISSETEKQQWQDRSDWGRKLLVKGFFSLPEKPRNRHGFDYSAYLASRSIIGTVHIEQMVGMEEADAGFSLAKVRADVISSVQRIFPERSAAYINALLFGFKDHSFQEVRQMYHASGLLHFFTISGMHVVLFFKWFRGCFCRLGFTQKEMLLPMGVFFLAIIGLCGGGTSVWRAVLALSVTQVTTLYQQRLSASDHYGIVLTTLLFVDPKVLLQTSGQLSLLMTFLIVMQQPIKLTWFWRSQFLTVLAAPVIASLFYEFPLFGGFLTFVFLPFFQMVLLPACFLMFVTGTLFPTISGLIALFEGLLLLMEVVVGAVGGVSITVGAVPAGLAGSCCLFSMLFYQKKRWLLVICFSLVVPIVFQQNRVLSTISYVDVGQGDSIVLQAEKNREVYVIDTGGSLSFPKENWQERKRQAAGESTLIPFLKGEGVRKITGLFLTHGDTDHMGDALALMKAIPVETLYLVPGSEQDHRIAKLLNELPKQTSVVWTTVGQVVGDFLQLQVLAPESGAGQNEDSLVIKTKVGDKTFLFTGDLEQAGEKKLIHDYPNLKVDVLKLGHHGSRTSTAPEFVAAIDPQFGIVSSGRNNRYGHPHEEVLETLVNQTVLRTDQQGMIQFIWSEKQQSFLINTLLDYPID
ncbi:DNA internalization-related competence protein ComEC/Rec2 [Enterococcus sp. AZ015]|uniref:DNA internalization-related competence protein ComEC/Rec2 n=1 Tax=Enterococcus sp. AZ015 TaxID=2774888 RepID=UPI003D2D7420